MAKTKNSANLAARLLALQEAEARIEQLRQDVTRVRDEELAQLHTGLGFASRQELIEALRSLDGPPARAFRGGKGRRPRISAETKGKVLKALAAGETGTTVAKRFGISAPSVQNIKKAAGMVKKSRSRKLSPSFVDTQTGDAKSGVREVED